MLEPFNGSNYKNAKGVLGSEIGMINIAENLVKFGHDVSISFEPILEGVHNGVRYISTDKLQRFIDFSNLDVIVINRYVHFFVDFAAKAKKVFVWVQDTTLAPNYCDFLLPNIALPIMVNCWDKIDGLILLSNWHENHFKKFYGIIGEEKKFYKIGNGINPEMFSNFSLNEKKRHKFIFNSNKPIEEDLNHAIRFFIEYQKNYPEAELHVFRGEVKNKVFNNGVFYRGNVSNDIMINELLSARFWIYPEYYAETYCTSALEARAAGCIPIVKITGGMGDSIGNLWYDINHLNVINDVQSVSEDRILESRNHALGLSWELRAKQWENLFRKGYI